MRVKKTIDNWYEVQRNLYIEVARQFITENFPATGLRRDSLSQNQGMVRGTCSRQVFANKSELI